MRTIWIDVEDLFRYRVLGSRPSGIQRFSFHVCDELRKLDGGLLQARFVRHASDGASLSLVTWPAIEELFSGLADDRPMALPEETPGRLRRFARKRLSKPLRRALFDVALTTMAFARAVGNLTRVVARWPSHRASETSSPTSAPEHDAFSETALPGDWLIALGAGWAAPGHAALIRSQCERSGLRFGLLVHDLIPARRPEWFPIAVSTEFKAWLDAILPLCDHVFAYSQATAADLQAYVQKVGLPSPGPVIIVPMGTELGTTGSATKTAELALEDAHREPPIAGDYVLFVSTIEVRKNHLLLFRLWRRLIEELPADQVPKLVFAGRIGWLVDDLIGQIANSSNLDGKLVVVEGPTDEHLNALYAGCLFTVFPSLLEGWGLPVTESLARGKPCFVSNASAVLEAGGDLARSFDANNLNDAYRTIEAMILDRAALANWEATVRRDFKPVPWSQTVHALVAGLADPDPVTADGAHLAQAEQGNTVANAPRTSASAVGRYRSRGLAT